MEKNQIQNKKTETEEVIKYFTLNLKTVKFYIGFVSLGIAINPGIKLKKCFPESYIYGQLLILPKAEPSKALFKKLAFNIRVFLDENPVYMLLLVVQRRFGNDMLRSGKGPFRFIISKMLSD